MTGWIDVTWDSGGSNSYRMGAEGKYDLQLSPNHDPDKLRPIVRTTEAGAVGGAKVKVTSSLVSDKAKVQYRNMVIYDLVYFFEACKHV